MLGLFRLDVYLQGGGHGGVDKAVNDGGNLLLDGGLITVGMTEVLRTVREGQIDFDLKSCVIMFPGHCQYLIKSQPQSSLEQTESEW